MVFLSSPNKRVVVVGGGIFGVSSATHLARLGVDVTLVTQGAFADGASGRSLSWLNSARRRSAAYHQLRMAGIDRYRTLFARSPSVDWLKFNGGLTWDADDETNEIETVFRHERSIGYDAQLLAPAEAANATPGVNVAAITRQGAIFNAGEGWVDLPSLMRHLMAEFVRRGGRVLENAGRAAVIVEAGRARGVTTARGERLEADSVLLAVGAAAPSVLAQMGIRIPDASPISLLVKTRPVRLALRAVLNTPRVAARPTPDGALALDSAWSEEEVILNSDGSCEVKASTVEGLLKEASAVLEGKPDLELESCGVGPKPIPADGEPVVGELDQISDYYVAFSHSGATLGLIIGELLANEIATGERQAMLEPFRPGRFS
jgi:glycine/D-amino acid oxidase-like deaminating enzyme